MIKITPDSIKDFQTCGLLYNYRHAEGLPETIPARQIMVDKFEETIKNVINFFFYKKQSGSPASYSALQNRWQKLWFPKGTSAQDVINEKHESAYGNMSSYTSKAAVVLMNFYEYFSDPEIIPIGISEEYSLPMNGFLIRDNYDLVYSKNNKIFIIKWMFNVKESNHHFYNVDFACMYAAYKKKNPNFLNKVSCGYYDIMEHNPRVELVKSNEDDLNALEFWLNEMSQKKNYVPRRGLTYYCKRCPFDTPCSKWTFKKDVTSNE